MSATKQLASMLDELMGRSRNALPTEKPKELTWSDPEVCKYYLVDYCPHELFTNTKADLGHCNKMHDDNLKAAYKKSSRYGRCGYENEFYSCLRKLHNEMARKITRNRQRLELTQPGGSIANMSREKVEEKISMLSEKVVALQAQAENLGNEGNVEEAQRLIRIADELAEERDHCRNSVEAQPGELKVMEVCDVCGCFLIVGDSQHRLDEHLIGKQHLGFAKIKETLEAYEKEGSRKPTRDSRSPSSAVGSDRHRRRNRSRGSDDRRSRGSYHVRSRSRSKSRQGEERYHRRSRDRQFGRYSDERRRSRDRYRRRGSYDNGTRRSNEDEKTRSRDNGWNRN